jgi:transposase-like protein
MLQKAFLRNAIEKTRQPTKITLDAYAAPHRAVREMKETGDFQKSESPIEPILERPH